MIVDGGDSTDVQKLYADLQMIAAGHPVATVMAAQIRGLAATLAFAARDHAQAGELVRAVARDLQRAIDESWDYVRQVRQASGLGQAGHG